MTFPVINDDILFIKGGIRISNRSETELSYNRKNTANNVEREHICSIVISFFGSIQSSSKCVICTTKECSNPQNAYVNWKLYRTAVVSWRMNVNKNISLALKRMIRLLNPAQGQTSLY